MQTSLFGEKLSRLMILVLEEILVDGHVQLFPLLGREKVCHCLMLTSSPVLLNYISYLLILNMKGFWGFGVLGLGLGLGLGHII